MGAHPRRRTSDSGPEMNPHMVKAIENGIKLDTLIGEFREVKNKVEVNALVAVTLQEHKTIDRVDILWTTMGEIRSSLKLITRLILGFIGLIPVVIGVLTFTHVVFHWPS